MVSDLLPGRRGWSLILGLSAAWFAFIMAFGSRHGTLSPGWADEVSHLYTTPIFWDHGTAIFREPTEKFLGVLTPEESPNELAASLEIPVTSFLAYPRILDLSKSARPGRSLELRRSAVFIVSPAVPRPYPPGVYLLFTPVSWLHTQGWLSAPQAVFAMIAFGLVVLHLSIFVFYHALKRTAVSRAQGLFIGFVAALAYAENVRWALNSQYDIVAVALLFAAFLLAHGGRRFTGLFLYALAFFLHLRALIFFPWAAWTFYLWWRDDLGQTGLSSMKPKHWLAIFTAALMVAAAGLTLVWNAPFFQRADLQDFNSMYWIRLGPGNWQNTLTLTTGLAVVLFLWWRERLSIAIACAVWCVFLLVQSRLMREWYVLFLLPFFLLVLPDGGANGTRPRYALTVTLGFYTLIAAIFMSNSPFEFRLVREMADAVTSGR